MKTISVLFAIILLASGAMAQDSQKAGQKSGKYSVIEIKVSSQCDMCKARIEEALAFEKGVKGSEVNVEKQIVTVTYKQGKTDTDKIRKAISKVGYDADDLAADPKAYAKLDACCKKPDDPNHEGH